VAEEGSGASLPDRIALGVLTSDQALYERLIEYGTAEADARGSAVDRVTARRIAITLLPRSQDEPDFMRGPIRFAKTGAVTHDLKARLRRQAWSATHPNRASAARLWQYAVARGPDLGPIGTDFGAVGDQIDQADALLADLRDRVINGRAHPAPDPLDTASRQPIAMARHDPASQTVTFILDAATANAAITINAVDREAHTREIQHTAQALPPDSYGRANHHAIAARETRIATRLRAIERAYQTALDPTPALELNQTPRTVARTPDYEPELE
jgi:hypothetical protein